MSKLKKIKIYYSQGGFCYLSKRFINYFVFLIKKRKLITLIKLDKLKAIGGEKGVKIFWGDKEVTNHHGFFVAFQVLTQWHESSEGIWKVSRVNERELEAIIRWKCIPISQIWNIKILNSNQIIWNMKLHVEQDMEIDECKIGVLLSPDYKRWISTYEEGNFPKIKNWEKIKLEDSNSKFIGVRNYKEVNNFLPGFFMEFPDTNFDINSYIINSSLKINVRILQIKIRNFNRLDIGWYDFLKIKMIVQDKEEVIEEWIEQFRKSIIKYINK